MARTMARTMARKNKPPTTKNDPDDDQEMVENDSSVEEEEEQSDDEEMKEDDNENEAGKESSSENDNDDDDDDDNEEESNDDDDDDDDDDDEGEDDEEDDGESDKEEPEVDGQEETKMDTTRTDAEATAAIKTPTARLSKSWSLFARHVPTFTGGSVTYAAWKETSSLAEIDDSDDNDDDEKKEQPQQQSPSSACSSVLLLPVGGDVAVVDAATGRAIASVRGKAHQWDATTVSADLEQDEDDTRDLDSITAYALADNQETLVTCAHNQMLRQYQVTQKKNGGCKVALVKTWGRSGHTLPVNCLAFHASHVFCATGSVDGTVRVWDVRGGFCTHVFRPLATADSSNMRLAVTALTWQPTTLELVLAVGRGNGSVAVHNLRDPQTAQTPVALLEDHSSAVTRMEWLTAHKNKNDNLQFPIFVTASRDAVLNVWKVTEGNVKNSATKTSKKKKKRQQPATFEGSPVSYVRAQTLPLYEQIEGMVVLPSLSSSQPRSIATAGSKGHVRLWTFDDDGGDDQLVLQYEQPASEAFGEDAGGYRHLLLCQPPSDNDDNEDSDDSRRQLLVADAEHNLHFLSLEPERLLQANRMIVGHNDDILDVKFIPGTERGRRQVAVATNSPQVRLFDLETFSCVPLDNQHTATVLCVDVSPCGRYLATCGKDKTMVLWRLATESESGESPKAVAVATGHTEAVGSTALSRKPGRYDVVGKAATNGAGAFVITCSVDRTMKRWNLPGASVLDRAGADHDEIDLVTFASQKAHDKDINIVTVAPNDSLIATGSQDKTAKIWNATDLTLQATLKGHKRGVWDCQFSSFDRVLATASGDRTIKLWSLSDYNCVRTFQGHTSSVLRVRFLSGGLQLASSGADGLLKVWTIRTNECETTMDGHTDRVWALDIVAASASEGGLPMLVSGGADSRLLVWKDVTVEEEEARYAELEAAMLLDQQLANHLRRKEYGEALEIALERDKPRHALRVFTAIIEASFEQGKDGLDAVRQHAATWSDERLARVMKYCRDWNTRARNAHIALLIVRAVVATKPVHKLAAMDEVPEIAAGILAYTERHFDRIDRLFESSYILSHVLSSMGSLGISTEESVLEWEKKSKLVLPPVSFDGRVQIDGRPMIGGGADGHQTKDDADMDIVTIGESSSDEEDSDSE